MYLEYRGVTTTMQEVKKIIQQSLDLTIELLKDWWINSHTLGLTHSWSITKPTLVGISKATLDKSLGYAQFRQDFKNKV